MQARAVRGVCGLLLVGRKRSGVERAFVRQCLADAGGIAAVVKYAQRANRRRSRRVTFFEVGGGVPMAGWCWPAA